MKYLTLENINLNTTVGQVLAQYIKSISGLTVSDKERAFLQDLMGLQRYKDPTQFRTALNTFIDNINNDYYRTVNTAKDRGYTGLAMSAYDDVTSAKRSRPNPVPGDTRSTAPGNTSRAAAQQSAEAKARKEAERAKQQHGVTNVRSSIELKDKPSGRVYFIEKLGKEVYKVDDNNFLPL